MTADQAAPCRHTGAPQPHVVESVSDLIRQLGSQPELLEKNGLTAEEYVDALPMAIEALRGSTSASNAERRGFITSLFEAMLDRGLIVDLKRPQYGDDTVYRLDVPGLGDVAVIQKGCPDGAHSSKAWTAPAWAVETYLWWMCDSFNYHPGQHVAKGVQRLQTRLLSGNAGALDGVIFHNQICGTIRRRCPKAEHSVIIGEQLVPPPCVYITPDKADGEYWNWQGDRTTEFPNVLLSLFDIPVELVPSYVGHVGFQRRGNRTTTTISSRFGQARSTMHRS